MNILEVLSKYPDIKVKHPMEIIYNNEKIGCYLCRRKIQEYEADISLYIIWVPTPEQTKYLKEDSFSDFQRSLLSDTYFTYRDDRRWNIYFIIISNEAYEDRNNVYRIERDSDYARKIVLKTKQVDRYFSKSPLASDQTNRPIENLQEEWEAELKKVNLDGCVYRTYSGDAVREYIENGRPIKTSGGQISTSIELKDDKKLRVNRITKVRLKDFRTHCFNSEFNFEPGLVTLLSGTNGCGKTSICEAIEFGLTGDIKRNSTKEAGMVNISYLDAEDKLRETNSIKDLNAKRQLDLLWYGATTTSNHTKPHLNDNYALFNFVSANAATMFKPDTSFKDSIINTVFGEEVTTSSKKIERFNEQFQQLENTYSREAREVKKQKNEIEIELNKVKSNLIQLSLLKGKMQSIGMNIDCYSDDKLKKFGEKEILNAVSYVNEIYNFLAFSKLKNYNDVKIELNLTKEKIQEIEIHFKKYSDYLSDLNNRKKLENQISKLDDNLSRSNYLSIEYKKVINEIETLSNHKINYVNVIDDFIDSFEALKTDYIFLKDAEEKYEDLKTYQFDETKVIFNIEALKIEFNKVQETIETINQELNTIKNDNDETEKNITELMYMGETLINKSKASKCPLCGYSYKSNEELILAVKQAKNILNNNRRYDKLLNSLGQCKKQKTDLEVKINKYYEIENCYSLIKKYININSLVFGDKLNYIKDVFNRADEKKLEFERQEQIYNKIKELIVLNEYQKYKFDDKKLSYEEYYKITIQDLKKELRDNEKALSDLLVKMEHYDIDIEGKNLENKNKYNELQDMLKKAENTVLLFEKLSLVFQNIKVCDFNKWYSDFNSGKDIVMLSLPSDTTIFEQNLIKLQKRIDDLDLWLERCKTAISSFCSLRKIEEVFDNFVGRNANTIEKVFNEIHMPKEFSELKIDKNGNITFLRNVKDQNGNSSRKIESDIGKISTGQSIALTIAIVITLHKSARNAPTLLIFDEPVANMDDIHMLNLIDMLRELALDNTQLIITTANTDIAGLLRRKFSFLEDKFKHLQMERYDINKTQIEERVYSPNLEEVKIKTYIC